MKENQASETKSILEQLASITSMERGKLTEVYRTRPAPDGTGTIRIGPYYKLQAWENGRNITRHVPAGEVPALKEDLANHQRFTELSASYENAVITQTRIRRLRSKKQEHADDAKGKKNSTKKRVSRGSGRPKPSSPKPGRC